MSKYFLYHHPHSKKEQECFGVLFLRQGAAVQSAVGVFYNGHLPLSVLFGVWWAQAGLIWRAEPGFSCKIAQ